MVRAFRLTTLAAPLALAAACATNPVTGKSQLSLISESQEIQMGKEANEQVKQTIGIYPNPQLEAYVSRLGLAMAARSERPQLPWEFHVVDDPAVNAFAIPGGFIYVTRGILAHMNSEAELVSVLGHEIGHVTAKHSVSQMSNQQLAQIGLGVGSILSPTVAKYGQVAGAGLQLLFLKYGRDAESQSDALGFRYMVAGGYDPHAMATMFHTLERVSGGAEAGGLPTFLSTHPDPGNRYATAMRRIDSLPAPVAASAKTLDRDEFLQVTNGIVFGENPRQGFFRNGLFMHPDLRFQIAFPDGWQTQNTPGAVLAGSPQQDAIMQLTTGQGTPQQAAQQFFAQQGIQSSNVQNTTINGLPTVSGYFQAQMQDGTAVRGIVSFLQYGNSTYQLLGYTPAAKLQQYDAVFRRAMGSFTQLTDQAALNAQPAKVELVRVPRNMTIAEFQAQYPSSIPVEHLAIINGVEAGGTLKAGTMAKRVVGGVQ